MIHTARAKSKFRKLIRLLRTSLPPGIPIDIETIAIGMLERLWHATATDAFRGDIGKLANDEIAESIGWFGDADLIVSILLESGWLDEHTECRLVVHDWAEHAPRWVQGNAAKYGGFIVPTGDSSKEVPIGDSSKDAPPNLTKPSLTNSNQAKPSLTLPGGDCGDACGRAGLDFLKLGENQYRDVMRQSVALNTAFGKNIESAELVWQLAWIGYACSEGVIPGCIEKFKKLKNTEKAVKSPQKWLIGCLNRELEGTGLTFEGAVSFVTPYSEIKEKAS
jgi:hypothetical protein